MSVRSLERKEKELSSRTCGVKTVGINTFVITVLTRMQISFFSVWSLLKYRHSIQEWKFTFTLCEFYKNIAKKRNSRCSLFPFIFIKHHDRILCFHPWTVNMNRQYSFYFIITFTYFSVISGKKVSSAKMVLIWLEGSGKVLAVICLSAANKLIWNYKHKNIKSDPFPLLSVPWNSPGTGKKATNLKNSLATRLSLIWSRLSFSSLL